jgi:catechol 2,3-dioxygenase-like lactoylglutathione lyase family enzyme
MDLRLELVPVPVADIDRAKGFYVDKLGFNADHDVQPADGVRVVQLTPPSSACSILLSAGLPLVEMQPGSIRGLHLVVEDIAEARAELVRRGVEVGAIQDFGGGVKGAAFSDPDGNSFELQEMAWRKGAEY